MPVTITAARARPWRVHWYEAKRPRSIFNPADGARHPLPGPKAKRVEAFEVTARTLDSAKARALEYIRKRGAIVLAVNYGQRPDELIVYTKETP